MQQILSGRIWLTLVGRLPIAAFVVAAAAATAAAEQVVSSVAELKAAISATNSGGGDRSIVLLDGTYTLDSQYGLLISGSGVSLRGASGNPRSVIVEGHGMGNAAVSHVFQVTGDDVTIESMTLRRVGSHAIQIHGESPHDADGTVLRNLVFEDTGQQMVKVSYRDGEPTFGADNGLVEDCSFEFTAGVGPQYYIGGIDAHSARNWVVRRNHFRGIRSPAGTVAEHAIHFWSNSEGTLCEKNVIVNCDRGIGYGLGSRGHVGGVIRNNMIYHADLGSDYGDVGIELENSSGTEVYNNTILQDHDYAAAIAVRWGGSSGVSITNNLVMKAGSLTNAIWQRDGSSFTSERNYIGTPSAAWFVDAHNGDLHLAQDDLPAVIDAGVAVPGLVEDFDGDPRPLGDAVDIGADERAVESNIGSASWGSVKAMFRS